MLPWFATLAHAGLPDLDEPLRTGAEAPQDSAVVIGLEDYAFLPDVPYAARDARAFYDFLVSTRGIPLQRVQRLESASREQIEAAVAEAGRLAGEQGTVWIYFAGHGVGAPSSGKRLLLGDDARQDPAAFESRGILVEDLVALARSGGGSVALLVDACFNGASRSGADVVAGTRFAVPAWSTDPTERTLQWAASQPDQLARPLHAVQHGAFTWLALGALRGWADGEVDGQTDGVVTAEEAQLFLARSMPRVGIEDQQPVLSASAPSSWVLSVASEPRPELGTLLGEAVLDTKPAAPRPTLPFHPDLLATAETYGVVLPLHRTIFGYKDAENERVSRYTYNKLVRSTPKGRAAYTRLYTGAALFVVGGMGGLGSGAAIPMTGDPRWAWGAGMGGAMLVSGMALLISGQVGVRTSLDPLPVRAAQDP